MPNSALSREVRHALYQLRRWYECDTLELYKFDGTTVDLRSGARQQHTRVYPIRRTICLPVKSERRVIQTVSKIGAAKEFVYGGFYDRSSRMFLVEQRELPTGLTVEIDDWFVYSGAKFQVKATYEYACSTLLVVIAQETHGAEFNAHHYLSADDVVRLDEEAEDG